MASLGRMRNAGRAATTRDAGADLVDVTATAGSNRRKLDGVHHLDSYRHSGQENVAESLPTFGGRVRGLLLEEASDAAARQ